MYNSTFNIFAVLKIIVTCLTKLCLVCIGMPVRLCVSTSYIFFNTILSLYRSSSPGAIFNNQNFCIHNMQYYLMLNFVNLFSHFEVICFEKHLIWVLILNISITRYQSKLYKYPPFPFKVPRVLNRNDMVIG